MFVRYSLRTTDVEAAIRFYADALSLVLPRGGTSEGSALEVWPLHERARALGAPPHWLGHLGVDDVDACAEQLVERGSQRLGPTVRGADGTPFATLRDPFGAVISVRGERRAPDSVLVAWHQLHTSDADGSWALYSELFGCVHAGTLDVPEPVGGFRWFAWPDGGTPVGGMGNTARWEGVHAHWLHCFPVADIDATVAGVRGLGGTAKDPVGLLDGTRLAACEDPQGAAFGLFLPSQGYRAAESSRHDEQDSFAG